jgi:hypothetical protein
MAIDIKTLRAKDPLIERLTIPVTRSMFERYRKLTYEMDSRGLDRLHNLTRQRLESLLAEVESALQSA